MNLKVKEQQEEKPVKKKVTKKKPVKLEAVEKPKKKKPKLLRTINRGPDIRYISEEDMRYFYAGYRMGAFDEYMKLESDMSATEFRDAIADVIGQHTAVYTAATPPLCFGMTQVAGPRMEAHTVWMPWATPRNRLETTLKFVREMNKHHTLITVASESNKALSFHIRKYGLFRYVGRIEDYFYGADDAAGYVFQGIR